MTVEVKLKASSTPTRERNRRIISYMQLLFSTSETSESSCGKEGRQEGSNNEADKVRNEVTKPSGL